MLLPSPIGMLGIELTGRTLTKVKIVPIGRERKLYTPLAKLKRDQRSDFLDEVLGRFSEYMSGARRNLDLAYDLKPSGLEPFAMRVLKETAKVGYGKTKTYHQISVSAGRPGAYRQVLAVLVNNPLPLVIPCHRVVTNKSGIGSYVGGTKKKEWLVKMESNNVPVL